MTSASSREVSATDAVEAWARSWFADADGVDRLSIDGIPCGSALHVEVAHVVGDAVSDHLGRSGGGVGRPGLRSLKRSGRDRAARAWMSRLLALGGRVSGSPSVDGVSIVSELATPSTFDGLAAVAMAMPTPPAVAAADPRAIRRWRAAGIEPSPLVLGLMAERRTLRAAGRAATDRWEQVMRDPRPLVVDGVDLTAVALEAVRPLVRRSLPWLVVESAAIREHLEGARPHTVLLATDQHRIGRLTVHRARQLAIRSVVLQHGLPQSTLGYLPLAADRMAVWSEGSADWFAARGVGRQAMTVVGNPRLDWIATATDDRAAVSGSDGASRGPRILLAMSVDPVESNRVVVDTTVDALRRLPAASLTIKLHPGGSDWTEALRSDTWDAAVRDRITVLDREPIEPLLADTDVVVAHRSTVVGEALAAGRPVVIVATDEPSIADAELSDLDLAVARDGEGLAVRIEQLSDGRAAAAYLAARRDGIVRHMGPIDGRSAARAAALVSEAP